MDIAIVVRQLKNERDRAAKEVTRLNAVLAALNANSYGKRTGGGTLSAAARARIAAAQRARWARVRASKGSAPSAGRAARRTMSAAARAKIARAQRLRWAKQKKSAHKGAA
jgi:hypothetical protein